MKFSDVVKGVLVNKNLNLRDAAVASAVRAAVRLQNEEISKAQAKLTETLFRGTPGRSSKGGKYAPGAETGGKVKPGPFEARMAKCAAALTRIGAAREQLLNLQTVLAGKGIVE